MVLLTTTPQILSVLSSLPPSTLTKLASTTTPATTTNPSGPPSINANTATSTTETASLDEHQEHKEQDLPLPTSTTSPISHHTLIALAHLRRRNEDGTTTTAIPSLNTLLRGTKPYVAPPAPKPAKSPEYIALMARLREEQEQREYAALLANRGRQRSSGTRGGLGMDAAGMGSTQGEEEGQEAEEDNISPSLVLNILLSVVMCGVAVFQMTKWYASDGVRVLMSLATAVVVGVAEVGVYSIYLMKVADAKTKERRKKERKVVVGQFLPGVDGTIPVDAVDATGQVVKVVGEKVEIWGRGVNGGVRRRVREKWEREQDKLSDEKDEK